MDIHKDLGSQEWGFCQKNDLKETPYPLPVDIYPATDNDGQIP
jgi:hypothetical protein